LTHTQTQIINTHIHIPNRHRFAITLYQQRANVFTDVENQWFPKVFPYPVLPEVQVFSLQILHGFVGKAEEPGRMA
jgi:hypothetical protein